MNPLRLRSYAQKNPLVEYKNEGFEMFDNMLDDLRIDIARTAFRVKVKHKDNRQSGESSLARASHASMSVPDPLRGSGGRPVRKRRRFGGQRRKSGGNAPLSLRQRQEIQTLLRGLGVSLSLTAKRRCASIKIIQRINCLAVFDEHEVQPRAAGGTRFPGRPQDGPTVQ